MRERRNTTLLSQCSGNNVALPNLLKRQGRTMGMGIALEPRYRGWITAVFQATLGLRTSLAAQSTVGLAHALRLCSRNSALAIDEAGLRFDSQSPVAWSSITKISVSRSYLDGHVAQMRVHHARGVDEIRVSELENGQELVGSILSRFKRINKLTHPGEDPDEIGLPILRADPRGEAPASAPVSVQRRHEPEVLSFGDLP
jgi:hypothetical protein